MEDLARTLKERFEDARNAWRPGRPLHGSRPIRGSYRIPAYGPSRRTGLRTGVRGRLPGNGGEAMTMANYLIVGAMKCGMAALHYCIEQHPQLYVAL